MRIYSLKSIARRGTSFGAAMALVVSSVGSAVLPTMSAFADSLNPLTERSLTLSSSSPGWAYTDGSGNSTFAPPNSGANGQKSGNYFSFKVSSPATVNTMSFQYCKTSAGLCDIPGNDVTRGTDTSTTSDLNVNYPSAAEVSGSTSAGTGTLSTTNLSTAVVGVGTSFTSAFKVGGSFKTAGNHVYQIKSIEDNTHLTLVGAAVATESGVAFSTSDFFTVIDPATGNIKAIPGYTNTGLKYSGSGDPAEAAKTVAGNFIVMYNNAGTWTQSTGWTATSKKIHNPSDLGNSKNYIILTNASGVALSFDQQVKVLFFATSSNYITNPGAGAFFVKINTYNKEYNASPSGGQVDESGLAPASSANIIDGGVTVANVMNQSIQITTKVLETMEFSVGTVLPDTLSGAELAASDYGSSTHIPCGRVLTRINTSDAQNVLQLGNQDAESSLETAKAYATHSYWRLSSNSSGGATVYYSGHTLSNTSGDEIAPIGTTAKQSAPGSEQFGLALATKPLSGSPTANTGGYGVNFVQDRATSKEWENAADNGKTGITSDTISDLGGIYTGTPSALWDPTDSNWNYGTTPLNASFHTARLDPLLPYATYANGSGRINGNDSLDKNGVAFGGGGYDTTNAQFAFDPMSDTIPAPIASESSQVVDCVTAKVRYIGNIAATTPAGIYTTKINYIAAPQY